MWALGLGLQAEALLLIRLLLMQIGKTFSLFLGLIKRIKSKFMIFKILRLMTIKN